MLVLTRRCGEQLVIAGDIIVTVVAVEGNKIRLGIEAPASVRVDRQEVHQRRLSGEDGGAPPYAAGRHKRPMAREAVV